MWVRKDYNRVWCGNKGEKIMNKGLEALERLYDFIGLENKNVFAYLLEQEKLPEYKNIIETELKRLEELEKEWEMEHTLRIRLENITHEQSDILRIIKEKYVDIQELFYAKELQEYNKSINHREEPLTQAEFDLLKGWLN